MIKLLQKLNLVDPRVTRDVWTESLWVGGNARLIQLGDVVNRGPDGRRMYQFLWALQDAARHAMGQVDLLIGNHELMLLQGNLKYIGDDTKVFGVSYRIPSLCSYVFPE